MILDEMEKASRTINRQNNREGSLLRLVLRGNDEIEGVNWLREGNACKLLLGIVVRGIGHEGFKGGVGLIPAYRSRGRSCISLMRTLVL